MATENLEYLDESGLNRTAGNVLAKIAESKAQIEEELNSLSYAKPDGIYPEMTVGAVIGADETAQWATRESEGTGSATVRSVQGAAVAFQQFYNQTMRPTTTSNGITVTNNGDGSFRISGTATADANIPWNQSANYTFKVDHKYLLMGLCPTNGSASTFFASDAWSATFTTYDGTAFVSISTNDKTVQPRLRVLSGTTIDATCIPQMYDLTAIYGAGNEPSTVAEFEAMYPEAYYPYSAPTLKPVQIAGIQSKDAQGNALDSIEWQTKTLRAAGSIADEVSDDELVTRVGVVDLGTLTWVAYNASTYPNLWYANITERANSSATASNDTNWNGYPKNTLSYRSSWNGIRDNDKSWTIYPVNSSYPKRIWINDSDYAGLTGTQVAAALSGKIAFYELATPTSQPISPALPMTYKVQAGGSESIIIPSGEISAAPIITIAEPVNMSTELAQIWAAIEALQESRQALQSNVRNDVQEITADLTPIDVTKEVQQTDENREVSE